MLDDDVAFKCHVIKLGRKPADLFAGGCGRSTLAQRSSLFWFKLNGRACQGSRQADTCFNFVLWCLEKEKRREKTEEKRQTQWTEFCIKRRNRIGYQGKTDQWIHFMQKTTNCTCIEILFREGEEVNDWCPLSHTGRVFPWTCRVRLYSMLSVSAITIELSLKVIYFTFTKTTTNQLMRRTHFRWWLLLWLIKHVTTAPQPPTAISFPFWKLKPIKWFRSNNKPEITHYDMANCWGGGASDMWTLWLTCV